MKKSPLDAAARPTSAPPHGEGFRLCIQSHESTIHSTSKPEFYKVLILEIFVLNVFQEHRSVLDIEGICWELTKRGEVHPVFVFERARDDLRRFMGS
jgi:hypothetical protein